MNYFELSVINCSASTWVEKNKVFCLESTNWVTTHIQALSTNLGDGEIEFFLASVKTCFVFFDAIIDI